MKKARKVQAAQPQVQSKSLLEEGFLNLLRITNMPAPIRNYRFHATRGWLLDFAWPEQLVAVEIEGGTRRKSRHTSPDGYQEDCIKYNSAALDGWLLLRYTGRDLKSRPIQVIEELQQALQEAVQ